MTRSLAALTILAGLHAGAVRAAEPPVVKTFDSNGVKIQYAVQGKGQPVVLIHGLYSSALVNWGLPGISEALAKDYQVIALDARGHGASDKPDDEKAYGTEMAEDVVRLLDHLKIKKAHVVGYSMGGMIAGKLLATHPDRIESCVLGGMGWFKDGSGLQKFWTQTKPKEFLGTPPACLKSLGKLAITEEELKAVRVPVTILVGDRDPVKMLYVKPLQEVRKDWKVVEIPEAGHINCIMKPQFKDEIQKWLAKQTGQ
jgi:pimeloyl-ACP methyl ester carboxylesterase